MLLPLGYVLGRRIGLARPSAFAAAYLAALVPSAVFFDAYALTDAVLPVIVLAWLVCVHIWLTETGRRQILIAGLGASLMAGWAEVAHSRGILIAAAQASPADRCDGAPVALPPASSPGPPGGWWPCWSPVGS